MTKHPKCMVDSSKLCPILLHTNLSPSITRLFFFPPLCRSSVLGVFEILPEQSTYVLNFQIIPWIRQDPRVSCLIYWPAMHLSPHLMESCSKGKRSCTKTYWVRVHTTLTQLFLQLFSSSLNSFFWALVRAAGTKCAEHYPCGIHFLFQRTALKNWLQTVYQAIKLPLSHHLYEGSKTVSEEDSLPALF